MAETVDKDGKASVELRELPSDRSPASSHIENIWPAVEEEDDPQPKTSEAEKGEAASLLKRAYRKVDLRLLACYAVLGTLIRIAEHNITNAAIMNVEQHADIEHQLSLSSEQWALVQSIVDYPGVFFQPVAPLLMRKATPRVWICGISILWGVCSMCQAALQSYAGLMAVRFLLGVLSAGMMPAGLYHLSCWYSAEKLTMRIAILVSIIHMSAVLSGLLAWAIAKMNGLAGLAGWRYMFLLEGAPVLIGGVSLIFFLPNYPRTAKFLTDEERTAIETNSPPVRTRSEESKFSWKQAKDLMTDPVTYGFLLIWICHIVGCTGLITVLPQVVYDLRLSGSRTTQLMTMPPPVIGVISILGIAYLIEKKKLKSWMAASITEVLAGVCFIVLLVAEQPIVRYVFITFVAILAFPLTPILWPERIRASEGATHAALAIGITSATFGLHGIVGPQLYQKKFGPKYKGPIGVSIALAFTTVVFLALTWAVIRRRDKKKEEQNDIASSGSVVQELQEERA